MPASITELSESKPETVLHSDPAELYSRLHPSTKRLYLDRVTELAREWGLQETAICDAAIALSLRHRIDSEKERRLLSHVGYYLLDQAGEDSLLRYLGKQPKSHRFSSGSAKLKGIVSLYLIASVFLCAVFSWFFIHRGDPIAVSISLVLCLFLMAGSTVRSWMEMCLRYSPQPPFLPQLDLRSGLTPEHKTAIAVPVLLLGKDHVLDLIQVMETHWAVTEDPNILIVLLTDLPDSDQQDHGAEDSALVDFCVERITALNEKPSYADRRPFFLLHRKHQFCQTQGRWMGWERKRGKLHQLFRLIESGANPFAETVGDVGRLRGVKYVVVLDEDSRTEADTVHQLVGIHAHPLNHPQIAETGKVLARGYGILQPSVSYSMNDKGDGEGLPNPRRDFFQDAFDRSRYWGKGIINVSAYKSVVSDSIPEECVLSHDCVESGLLSTAAVLDATIFEPLPEGHEAFCLRKHRWMRGDMQNARFLLANLGGRKMTAFGKVHILDLLTIVVVPVASAIVIFRGIAVAHVGLIAAILITVIPMYVECLWIAGANFVKGRHHRARRSLVNLLRIPLVLLMLIEDAGHSATISADAIARTLYRMARGRKLLEWQTSTFTQKHRSKLNLCKIYRLLGAVAFGMAAIWAWIFAGNIPAALLLFAWALHPTLLFSSNKSPA